MAKLSDLFPSKYLKAQVDVIEGENVTATIAAVTIDEFENNGKKEHKPVLELEEFDKPMVCNKTNSGTIGAMYGDDTDDWVGKKITLMSMEVKGPNATLVDSIVVSKRKPVVAAKAAPKRAPAKVTQADADEASAEHAAAGADDIPF